MTFNAEVLLAGPRGRRLCLEVAAELDPDVRNAVFQLGYELDPGRGTSVVMFGDLSKDAGSRPAASADTLAALLGSMDVPDLTEDLILDALQRSVMSARYWQEPDGEDVLAAIPAIRRALQRVAERAVVMEVLRADSRTQRQWAIDWRGPDDPAPLGRDPEKTLAKWGRAIRADELTWRESRRGPEWTGDWWSIPLGLTGTVGRIPAGLNLVEDYPGWERATTIPVDGAGRTFEIRSEEDWVLLCRRFPLEVSASRRWVWLRTTGREGRWVIPDWELVAREWDAVHLTVPGYLSCAGRALAVDERTGSVIAGWDPDRTIWLTDVVRETGEPRQYWRRSPNGDGWFPV
ncbi:hypothetical protein LJ756_00430 [Arthrobacter sp. zg-Y411]|uniref:hypothetical protein n=1 Tax=Arthrobacter zhangbolii TaxID=2886936 RepID=UPI001D1487CF|nr:hypothetical protein [Arthrobacter zhangbolii]MCC3293087.1 hypothetical protein [Arthrobacter zhangbolii]